MSDYVVESGASSRARARRRRAAITLLIVVLLLFGAFWYAYSYYRSPPATATPKTTPTTSCTTVKPADKVTVNVYNATGRDGLAASTAEELKSRGFVIGKVSNDPLSKTIKASAEVRYGKAGAKLSTRVVALVSKPTKVQDTRKDASVDLVLGNGFRSLTVAPKAVATSTCG